MSRPMPWHMPWHEHRSAIHALPRLVRAMGAILPLLSHRKPGSRRGSSSEPDWEQVGSVGQDISPIEKQLRHATAGSLRLTH